MSHPSLPTRLFSSRVLRWALGLTLGCGAVAGGDVRAETHPSRNDADAIARLDRQLRELRALLSDVQRSEREHFETVRRLLDRTGGATPLATERAPQSGGAQPGAESPAEDHTASPEAKTATLAEPLALATVTGRVSSKGPLRDVYVYLDGFRSNAGRKAEIEVVQTRKTFEPAFSVALVGTRATFPNRDTFFHNVFSTTPVPFDLGTYRADETPPSVTLKTPGVVELSCNIHAQMRAQILVVPNRVYTRVSEDGTFRLEKVPAGRRTLVAWGPGLRGVRLEVKVPPKGAAVTIELDPEVPTRHLNKFGLPYGSYKE